jgi:hypothetical protein
MTILKKRVKLPKIRALGTICAFIIIIIVAFLSKFRVFAGDNLFNIHVLFIDFRKAQRFPFISFGIREM